MYPDTFELIAKTLENAINSFTMIMVSGNAINISSLMYLFAPIVASLLFKYIMSKIMTDNGDILWWFHPDYRKDLKGKQYIKVYRKYINDMGENSDNEIYVVLSEYLLENKQTRNKCNMITNSGKKLFGNEFSKFLTGAKYYAVSKDYENRK